MTTPTNGSGAATTAATPDNDNDDDRLSQRLWHDALPLAYFSLHHPFVHGIAAGTLPRAQWLDYVAQDAHYLRHFSSAYAHAMDKLDARAQLAESGVSGGGPEQAQRLRDARARVGRLLSSVLDELRLHGGYAARWGVPKETLERGASRETEAYTGFLHSVAADPRSPPGDVLAAMAPCLRLYAWLGCSLKSGNEAARRALGGEENNPNPYGEWVETYSGEEYKAMVEVGERLLDEAAALGGGDGGDAERDFAMALARRCSSSLGAAQQHRSARATPVVAASAASGGARLSRLYRRAMRLEAAFFSGSAVQTNNSNNANNNARRADLLVVDFDDTCTERDTIGPLLARVAEAADGGNKGGARSELVARLSAGYLDRYQALMAELLPPAGSDSQTAPPPPRYTLPELLERLSDFDAEMNRVVEREGALAGVDGVSAGTEVARGVAAAGAPPTARLREGCARVLSRASDLGVPVHVVSVNWSAKMVAAILQAAGVDAATAAAGGARGGGAAAVTVHANELAVGPDGLTTGTIDVTCECARDKARVFGEIVDSETEGGQGGSAAAAANGSSQTTAAAARQILSPAKGAKVDAAQTLERMRSSFEAAGAAAAAGAVNGAGAAGGGGVNGHSAQPTSAAYVGDSLSDLPALLAADYGIVVGSNGTLRRVLAAYGIPLLPLVSAATMPPRRKEQQQQQQPVLFEASGGWPEIEAFLFGPGPGASAVAAIEAEAAGAAEQGAAAPRSSSSPSAAFGRGVAVVAAAAAATGDADAAANDAPPRRAAPSDALAAAVAAAQAAAPRRPAPPLVLTVAGSDSGGGAGVQADLKTFLSRGAFGMSCVTALTAQNTAGVASVHVPPAEVLEAQLDAVLDDLGAAAVKTGMLPDGASVRAVAGKLRSVAAKAAAERRPAPALVVDPVLVTTSGHALASDGVASTLLRELFPLATVVTPNLDEAAVLLAAAEAAEVENGSAGANAASSTSAPSGLFKSHGPVIDSVEAMKAAAKRLHEVGRPRYVLLKGGHLAAAAFAAAAADGAAATTTTPPPEAGLEAIDILYDGREFVELRAPYVRTGNTHGTGCTLAAALAAELAHGRPVAQAAAQAKAYLTEALAASACLSLGGGPQRPFDHGTWLLRRAAVDELGGGWSQQQQEQGDATASGRASAAGTVALQATGVLYNPCDLRVYAVTDPGLDERQGRTVAQSVALAVAGGATIVQIRQKHCDGGKFLAAVRSALAVCRAAGVPLLVNDRVDVALAAGADGVHVGQDDLPAAAVRRMLGPRAIVGVSVKTAEEAVKAQADGADYVGCGAVFATGTKDSSVIGIEGLRAVCDAIDIPVVAIGGVGAANAEQVLLSAPRRVRPGGGGRGGGGDKAMMKGGCAGLAVVSAIFGKEDARGAAEELRAAVERALDKRERIEEEEDGEGEAAAAAAAP